MTRGCHTRESQAGFTLVELLVSLAILSLLSVYTVSALGIMRDAKRVSADLEKANQVELAVRYLQHELEGAIPLPKGSDTGQFRPLFKGETDQVTFAILSDGTREFGGVTEVTYLVNEKNQLISRRRVYRPKATPTLDAVLLEGVEGIAFSYGADQSTWIDQDQLPRVVGFALEMQQGGGRAQVQTALVLGNAGQ
jgi:general secretion pathway protein J